MKNREWCLLIALLAIIAGCSPTASLFGKKSTPSSELAPERRTEMIDRLIGEARLAERKGETAKAKRTYEKILELDPQHPDSHHRLAIYCDNDEQFTAAEKHYRAALAADPLDPDYRTTLGWSYILQGRLGEAEAELSKVLASNPSHQIALYNLGWIHVLRGEEERAMALFRAGGSEVDAWRALESARDHRNRTFLVRPQPEVDLADLSAPSPRKSGASTPRTKNNSTKQSATASSRTDGSVVPIARNSRTTGPESSAKNELAIGTLPDDELKGRVTQSSYEEVVDDELEPSESSDPSQSTTASNVEASKSRDEMNETPASASVIGYAPIRKKTGKTARSSSSRTPSAKVHTRTDNESEHVERTTDAADEISDSDSETELISKSSSPTSSNLDPASPVVNPIQIEAARIGLNTNLLGPFRMNEPIALRAAKRIRLGNIK